MRGRVPTLGNVFFPLYRVGCLAGILVLSSCAGETFLQTPASTRPGRDFRECPAGQQRVCINKCRDVINSAREEARRCTVDPCAANGEGVCGKFLDCVPDGSGLGTCKSAATALCHATLDRSGENFCSAGTSCIAHSCPNSPDTEPSTTFDGSCLLPSRENQACDDNCRLCEPGTSCVPGGTEGVCRRLCTGDGGECASDSDRCLPLEGGSLFCVQCSRRGEIPPAGGTCCPFTTLGEDGRCSCSAVGETLRAGGVCCHGTVLRDGVCTTTTCNPRSTPCWPAAGECAAVFADHCHADGSPDCDGLIRPVPGPELACNHLDDDCDGHVDEGFISTPCSTIPANWMALGCNRSFEGHFQCVRGSTEPKCVIDPALICTTCGAGCGKCAGSPCMTDRDCTPNMRCGKRPIDPPGTQSYCLEIIIPDGRETWCPGPACYRPSERGDGICHSTFP